MTQRQVIIDTLNIRLANGWRGDPVYLARKISEQIQGQSQELNSTKGIDLTVQGHFSGNAKAAGQQLSRRLTAAAAAKQNSSGEA